MTRRSWRGALPLAIGLAAAGLAVFLLYRTLSNYALDDIVSAIGRVPGERLLLCGLFAAASYACLTGFDWLALRYVGARIPYPKVALASFCSLSLGHNIGFAAASSGAIRYRFYARWGVPGADIVRVIAFCGVTVGLGLVTLGGVALLLRGELAAQVTGLAAPSVAVLGAVCLAVPAAYLAAAAAAPRALRIYRWKLKVPSVALAAAQIAVGSANFACVAACLYNALATFSDAPYADIAAAYVIANVTALIAHVPGGLGVIETVMLYALHGERIVAGLVIFRLSYFLVPLALGLCLFALSEIVFRRRAAKQTP